ncbi:Ig-like domain-containing protein [Kitasatospora sp. NPDC048365]|uniref:Ig-like domain-containing protein n=1 Tax=Kitasatospora sp. NPDC048365 TaxID=3364050 RepID=UPI003717EE70
MNRTTLTAVVGTTGLLAAALVPVAAASAAPPSPQAASPCGAGGVFTVSPPTCSYSAAGTDTFTVPDGVTAVTVDLFGAEGGSAAGYVAPNPPNTGAPGGPGGESRATLAVRPGERLQLTLGAAGTPGTSRHGEFARPGGYGHGSGGGGAHGGGGSGGGGSDVRTGAFGPSDRVLVAGGGGGAGNGGPLLHGGAGGGPVGEDGGQGGGPDGSGVAGGGGESAPGAGSPNSALGGPGVPGGDYDMWTGLYNPGSGGTGGNGARGGNGGGGGGGGWQGGAGGSGGGNPGNLYGAGGGGGSSWAAPGATDVSLLRGVNHGAGRATVTFRYGSTTTLTADERNPLFGHPVTLTATVASAAGTPDGTVTFTDGTRALATVPLTDGRASYTTAALQPGAHPVTASFGGSPDVAPSGTAQPLDLAVGFSGPCLTTAHHGPLAVDAGSALCLGPGGSQNGPLTVRPGGALAVLGARLDGPLTSDGALALTVCGSTLSGPVTVRTSAGEVRLGAGADGCDGNTVTAPVRLTDNAGPVLLDGNTVTGPLRCEGNAQPPALTGNTVSGPRSGQCR